MLQVTNAKICWSLLLGCVMSHQLKWSEARVNGSSFLVHLPRFYFAECFADYPAEFWCWNVTFITSLLFFVLFSSFHQDFLKFRIFAILTLSIVFVVFSRAFLKPKERMPEGGEDNRLSVLEAQQPFSRIFEFSHGLENVYFVISEERLTWPREIHLDYSPRKCCLVYADFSHLNIVFALVS